MIIDASKTSPHHSARPKGVKIRLVVLHADASASHLSSINWILHPKSKVSYHFIIARDGGVTQLVPEDRKAWHAGISSFKGVKGCNDYSIGVSFSNKNDGVEPYDPRAIAMGVDLVAALCRRYGIVPTDGITTHAIIAPGRKTDPGPRFPFETFIADVHCKLKEAP